MTITEYYNNYLTIKQFPNRLLNGQDSTVDDFYNSCIVKNLCPISNVLAWHKMFMKYVDMNDAILWVRYYEGGSKVNGRYRNRRACYTEFADGFSYVFVSNYDAHEIYNMVFQGITPDVNEFKDLMKTFKYPLHYDNGPSNSCEESDICAYPHIGEVTGGVLTDQGWYLAHVYGIKDDFLRPDGTMKTIDKKERDRIFPRGSLNDWQIDPTDGIMKRKLNYSLSADEKALVKAHFLRFVDPLNYFIVPGESYENHAIYSGKRIGEYKDLTEYVGYEFEHVYGTELVKEFRDKALICMPISVNIPSIKAQNINIIYGRKLKTNSKSTSSSTKTKTTTYTLKNKKIMLIEQTKDKYDLRDRLMAYVTKPKAFVTPLKKVSRRAHKLLLDNNCPQSSAKQYYNWLDPTKHPELNDLLLKHGIKGSIYTCTNLTKIASMFDELVDNTSEEAKKANKHQNMVSAVRHFIEHLLSVNGITI